jgi:hypothetical protein
MTAPLLAAALLTAASLATIPAHAQNAEWAPLNPLNLTSLDDPNNWVPKGAVPAGIATFAATSGTIPTTTAATTFGEIMFTSSAPRYNFAISGGNTHSMVLALSTRLPPFRTLSYYLGQRCHSKTAVPATIRASAIGEERYGLITATRAVQTLKIKAPVP